MPLPGAVCSPFPGTPRPLAPIPGIPRLPARPELVSSAGKRGRSQSRRPARGRHPAPPEVPQPPRPRPGLPLSAPALLVRVANAGRERRREQGWTRERARLWGRAGIPRGAVRPGRRARGPGRRGSAARAHVAPRRARPPRGGLARGSGDPRRAAWAGPPRLCSALPSTALAAFPYPAPGPHRRFPGAWGAAATAAQDAPGAAPSPGPRCRAARDTHCPQPSARRPHWAPRPDPRTCCFPRSPLSGWAERFVAMSPIILEVPVPAARRSARFGALCGLPAPLPLAAGPAPFCGAWSSRPQSVWL